jgi:hypothetical protein
MCQQDEEEGEVEDGGSSNLVSVPKRNKPKKVGNTTSNMNKKNSNAEEMMIMERFDKPK